MLAIAKLERDNNVTEAWSIAQQRAVSRGVKVSQAPYGYRRGAAMIAGSITRDQRSYKCSRAQAHRPGGEKCANPARISAVRHDDTWASRLGAPTDPADGKVMVGSRSRSPGGRSLG